MKYSGKIYGKVGGEYFPLLETTEDVENLKNRIAKLEAENKQLRLAAVVATEGKCCGYFIQADGQTSATICETCGQEKYLHAQH